MKIINRTHFLTKDLRAILLKAADITLKDEKRKHTVVTVVYGKSGGSSGCAYIGGRHATVRISKQKPQPDSFACVAAHEYRHLNGWSHAEMKACYSWEDVKRYAWANTMPLRIRDVKKKARPGNDDKLALAQRNLAKALTRLKRAVTLAKKWKLKVRYYERKATAAPALPMAAAKAATS